MAPECVINAVEGTSLHGFIVFKIFDDVADGPPQRAVSRVTRRLAPIPAVLRNGTQPLQWEQCK